MPLSARSRPRPSPYGTSGIGALVACTHVFACGARTGLPLDNATDAGSDAASIPTDAAPPDGLLYAGFYSTCFVKDGTLTCWGATNGGWPGDPTMSDRLVPAAVVGLPGPIAEISLGGAATCVRVEDGRLYCWGYNGLGAVGNGATSTALVTIPSRVVGITSAVSFATGLNGIHECATLADGTTWCWGNDTDADFDTNQYTGTNVPTPVHVPALDSATKVSIGTAVTCAVFGDGSVKCVGNNEGGQCGLGTISGGSNEFTRVINVSDAIDVVVASESVCALTVDRTEWCWGQAWLLDGEALGEGTPFAVTGIGPVKVPGVICVLLVDGTVDCAGDDQILSPVPGLGDVYQLVTGFGHTCALRYDGKVLCWGHNDHGQLGDGTTTNRATPTVVRL